MSDTPVTDESYWVQLWHEFTPLGGGFLLAPTFVLTAAHCVRGLPDGQDKLTISVPGRESYDGQLVHVDGAVDLALIEVAGRGIEDAAFLEADRCRPNDPWFAPYRPSNSDPHLAGAVVSGSIDYQCESGAVLSALQLQTFLELGDYSGYSGGPIERRLSDEAPRLAGMLIEQYFDRHDGERASNVLFAATIHDILGRLPQFQLRHLRAVLFEEELEELGTVPDDVMADRAEDLRFTQARRHASALLDFIKEMTDSGRLTPSAQTESQISVMNLLIEQGREA